MSWWGVGALAVSTVGSVYQGSQAGKAADASAAGSAAAQAQNAQQFEQTQLQNLLLNAPTINSGNIARSELMGILGLDSPGVDYGQYWIYLPATISRTHPTTLECSCGKAS